MPAGVTRPSTLCTRCSIGSSADLACGYRAAICRISSRVSSVILVSVTEESRLESSKWVVKCPSSPDSPLAICPFPVGAPTWPMRSSLATSPPAWPCRLSSGCGSMIVIPDLQSQCAARRSRKRCWPCWVGDGRWERYKAAATAGSGGVRGTSSGWAGHFERSGATAERSEEGETGAGEPRRESQRNAPDSPVDTAHHWIKAGDCHHHIRHHRALAHGGHRLQIGEAGVPEVGAERPCTAVGDNMGPQFAARTLHGYVGLAGR